MTTMKMGVPSSRLDQSALCPTLRCHYGILQRRTCGAEEGQRMMRVMAMVMRCRHAKVGISIESWESGRWGG